MAGCQERSPQLACDSRISSKHAIALDLDHGLFKREYSFYECATVITTFPFLWPCSTYANASAIRSRG